MGGQSREHGKVGNGKGEGRAEWSRGGEGKGGGRVE